jgi:hypothetical protein
LLYNNTDRKYAYSMPADMILIISYSRICEPIRMFEKIVNIKLKYNNVTTIIENHKQKQKNNSCLEMFRIW